MVKFFIVFKVEFSEISFLKTSMFDTLDKFIYFILFKHENICLIFYESTILKLNKDILNILKNHNL